MKKQLLLLLILPLFTLAQSTINKKEASYISGFYENIYTDTDSTLFYARCLAKNPQYKSSLRELLHQNYFWYFTDEFKAKTKDVALKSDDPNWESSYESLINQCFDGLYKMSSDSCIALKNSATPILYWVNIKRNKTKPVIVGNLVNRFITLFLTNNNIYENRSPRYALMIYDEIHTDTVLAKVADLLLFKTFDRLSRVQLSVTQGTSKTVAAKRAWLRYLYANASYSLAKAAMVKNQLVNAETYFKIAIANLPDSNDLQVSESFDMEVKLFPHHDQKLYQNEYDTFLSEHKEN